MNMTNSFRLLLVGLTLILSVGPAIGQPGLIGHWPLDETEGLTAADVSGMGKDGTLENGVAWAPTEGLNDGALSYDVANDSGRVVISTEGMFASRGTAMVWGKLADPQPAQTRYFFGHTTQPSYNNRIQAYMDNDSLLDLGLGGSHTLNTDIVELPLDTWLHVALTWNAGNYVLYLDGQEIASGSYSALSALHDFMHIGNDGNPVSQGTEAFGGLLDDMKIFDRALEQPEILRAMFGRVELAKDPTPAIGAADVSRDTALSWLPGKLADTHNVYLGTSFEDVNEASETNPRGVLESERQSDTSYQPGRLEFNTTYYWRIDEVNGPTSPGIHKGETWNFTTELLAYPVTPAFATASTTFMPTMGPENTINGSGLDAMDQHGTSGNDMWLTAPGDAERWIQYEFAKPQKIHEMLVWNSNQAVESFVGFGLKSVTIETSMDSVTWTVLADVPEFAQAPGAPDYTSNTTVEFGGITVKYVKLTVNSGYGTIPQFGLSEIRFLAIPVYAREPQPMLGETDLPTEVTLAWRAGRDAGSHDVYLGADPNSLTLIGNSSDASYTVSVNLDQTQYWRIDEVNEAEETALWIGDIWNFTTALYTVIDNMESYKDAEFLEIWATWVDGYGDASNGAVVGNGSAPEADTVYDGGQSMPMLYGDEGAANSEATRTFDQAMDWSKNGVKNLSLMFHGEPGNTPGQLYVGINGNRVADYPGATDDLKQAQWHTWQIDLASLGITTVNSMTIGIQGGNGTIYVDAIRLYPTEVQLTDPVIPDDTGLVAYYPLDNNTQDISGNGRNGTAVGDPLYVPGPAGLGSGIDFDGTGNQYVDLGTWDPSAATGQLTVSIWVKWGGVSGQWQGLIGKRDSWSESGMMWDLEANRDTGVIRFGRNGSTVNSGLALNELGEWEPWAVTTDGTSASIYRNGLSVASGDFTFGTKADANMQIGAGQITGGNPYNGSLSEIRLYDRVLTPAEVAGQAGRTAPFFMP